MKCARCTQLACTRACGCPCHKGGRNQLRDDALAYDTYVECGRNAREAARQLGIRSATVRARVKREAARRLPQQHEQAKAVLTKLKPPTNLGGKAWLIVHEDGVRHVQDAPAEAGGVVVCGKWAAPTKAKATKDCGYCREAWGRAVRGELVDPTPDEDVWVRDTAEDGFTFYNETAQARIAANDPATKAAQDDTDLVGYTWQTDKGEARVLGSAQWPGYVLCTLESGGTTVRPAGQIRTCILLAGEAY